MAQFIILPANMPERFDVVNVGLIQRVKKYGNKTAVIFSNGRTSIFNIPIEDALFKIGDSVRQNYEAAARGEGQTS